jgi:hypothetical protein
MDGRGPFGQEAYGPARYLDHGPDAPRDLPGAQQLGLGEGRALAHPSHHHATTATLTAAADTANTRRKRDVRGGVSPHQTVKLSSRASASGGRWMRTIWRVMASPGAGEAVANVSAAGKWRHASYTSALPTNFLSKHQNH